MSVQVSNENNTVPFVRLAVPAALKQDGIIAKDTGRSSALAPFTVLGKIKTLVGAVTPNGSNTGDGTVTGLALARTGLAPLVGSYNLECIQAGLLGRVAGATTPGGSNTGNGTVTLLSVASGEVPEIGDFTLICIDKDTGGAKAGSAAFSGTGNGTASAVVTGVDTLEGDYLITCVDASVSGSEIFSVVDPNGDRLDDLVVGVAYLNTRIGFTLTDGSTDFIVGDVWTLTMTIVDGGKFKLTDPNGVVLTSDLILPGTAGGTLAVVSGGISFTITDGSTDFAVDDEFTMAIAVADGGKFKLEDPNGNIVDNDIFMSGVSLGAVTIYAGGLTFIITDGATDFIIGDKFGLAITAGAGYLPMDPAALNGLQEFAGILMGSSITAAAIVAAAIQDRQILVGDAYIDKNRLVFENSLALSTLLPSGKTLEEEMASLGIFNEDTVDISSFEN